MLTAQEATTILEGLEPGFVAAGKRALELQGSIQLKQKGSTGDRAIDAVTEADLSVQELILSALAETPLVGCQLFAEEATPSVGKFAMKSDLSLTLDPIDGTLGYAKGSRYFRSIVGLRTADDFLYTFVYFPGCNVSIRITDSVQQTGNFDLVPSPAHERTVVYSVEPRDAHRAAELTDALAATGYTLAPTHAVGKGGSITFFLAGTVGGYFNGWPNVHDSFVAAHYASAKGWPIYYRDPDTALKLDSLAPGRGSERFTNDYYVIREE